jgi:peptidoglycan/LPS O-acetylase OafA/YrhL
MARSFQSVQCLRGAAALLVVFQHAREQIPDFHRLFGTTIGEGGVDLFFVISGFVMVYSTGADPIGRWEFLKRRLFRVVPLYWVVTGLTAALLLVAPALPRDSMFTVGSLIGSLLFWPHINPGDPMSISPMLKLGWTLNYEMFFYVVFAVFMGLQVPRRIAAMTVIFAGLCLAAGLLHGPAPLIFWGDSVTFEFILGAALGWLAMGNWAQKLPGPAWIAVSAAGLVLFVVLADAPGPRVLSQGGPAALIVGGLALLEARQNRAGWPKVLLFLGDASYSIYLGHLYAVIAFRVLWEHAHLPAQGLTWGLIFVGLCMVTGMLVGIALHLAVERPVARLFKRRRTPASYPVGLGTDAAISS